MLSKDLIQLSTSSLFKGVDILALDALFKSIPFSIQQYDAGSLILSRGEVYNHLYIVLEGHVDADMYSSNGKTIRVETISAPEAIATGILFSKKQKLPVSVTAGSFVRLVVLSEETVLTALQKNRIILRNFLQDIGAKLDTFSEKFRILQLSTLRQRISYWLFLRLPENSNTVLIPFSKEQLATVLGVARPSLSRELSEMEKEKVLTVDGRSIIILQKERIERWAEE